MEAAESVDRSFLQWVGDGDESPYFAFLNYMEAHRLPFVHRSNAFVSYERCVPPPGLTRSPSATPQSQKVPRVLQRLLKPFHRTEQPEPADFRDAYDVCIGHLDLELAALFRELERRGLLRNALVVVTSDHGEQFG